MKVGIVGCGGRMGRMLSRTVLATEGATLVGGTERADGGLIGTDIGVLLGGEPVGAPIEADPRVLFEAADVVIDFTAPEATAGHAALAAEFDTALVIGTTGLEAAHQAAIDKAATKIPVVQAPNMAMGVNLLFALTERVARTLGVEFDIEIVEMHHRHKVDAPSGTALGLGRAAAKGRGADLDEVACRARDGQVGARPAGEIGFATLRGGDVVGDHTVVFAGEGERIELTHKASSREIFARGAVRAAMWLDGRGPGVYSMFDVLGLD